MLQVFKALVLWALLCSICRLEVARFERTEGDGIVRVLIVGGHSNGVRSHCFYVKELLSRIDFGNIHGRIFVCTLSYLFPVATLRSFHLIFFVLYQLIGFDLVWGVSNLRIGVNWIEFIWTGFWTLQQQRLNDHFLLSNQDLELEVVHTDIFRLYLVVLRGDLVSNLALEVLNLLY